MRRLRWVLLLLAAMACHDMFFASRWTVTYSAVVEGGTGTIAEVTWRENLAQYVSRVSSTSWSHDANLEAGSSVYLRVSGTTTGQALIRARISARSSGEAPFSRDTTCTGSATACQIGPLTLPQ